MQPLRPSPEAGGWAGAAGVGPTTVDEASMERSKSFVKALQVPCIPKSFQTRSHTHIHGGKRYPFQLFLCFACGFQTRSHRRIGNSTGRFVLPHVARVAMNPAASAVQSSSSASSRGFHQASLIERWYEDGFHQASLKPEESLV